MKPRLLLVERNSHVARAFTRCLAREYEIRTARCYVAALEELAIWPADVVVSARHLGSPDGLALLERVRESHPPVARILVSTNIEGAKTVAHRALRKPIAASEIGSVVEELLRSAHGATELAAGG